MAEKVKKSSVQIYDKKQKFPKNIIQQKHYQQISEKKNRGTNCRYQYQGTNSVGQAYE